MKTKNIKKLLILMTVSMIAAFFIVINLDSNQTNHVKETLAKTINDNFSISMESHKLSYQPLLIAPYTKMDVFISDEKTPGFEFTTIGGAWQEIAPDGTKIEVQVQFKVKGVWSEWLDLEEEEDYKSEEENVKFITASSNPATAIKYKIQMYGDGIKSPIIKDSKWTFIRTKKNIEYKAAPVPKYSSNSAVSESKYIALTSLDNSMVIKRSAWNADESLRYLPEGSEEAETEQSGDYYETFKDELDYASVITKDSKGNNYVWPLEYAKSVKKIIIHHTATTSALDDPKQTINDIYYYHAITRGWGDIGYNYIIDTEGRIYEGRYGGEKVIGGHASKYNNGSIGIAVLGNYEVNELPKKVIFSMSQFIAQKARIHNIKPDGYSVFRGQNLPNIIGHKDVGATACPGINLYSKLPIIRKLAVEAQTVKKVKFIKDYDYLDHSELYFLDLNPNETVSVTIKLENIGKVDWNKETFILVNDNPEFANTLSFPTMNGVVLAKMNEVVVKPGEFGTFNFTINSLSNNGLVYMKIAPVINGIKKIPDYLMLPVNIQQGNNKYELIEMTDLPKAMDKGEEATIKVKLKNTGTTTWRKSGANTVRLGTDHERDRLSEFTVPASTRIGFLEEDEVKPEETGTFVIKIKAPNTVGYYREYFTPVVEGESWMDDSGMFFETSVYGEEYELEIVQRSPSNIWERGEKYLIWIKVRNLGKTTWKQDDIFFGLIKEQDLIVTNPRMLEAETKPGEIATIQYQVLVNPKEDLNTKAMMIRPMINGINLYPRPIYFYYTVVENKNTIVENTFNNPGINEAKENDIRVKLGFTGNPEITASGNYSVYSGEKLLESLTANQKVRVVGVNGSYQISSPNKTYIESNPIRFVPQGFSIMEIVNFNHSPGWNPELNDNKYRGTLEVRDDGKALIIINELNLEDYLKGLGEVSNNEEFEKIKAIMVAARTYAKFYMTKAEKFPGKPYNLDDNPDICQKYLGYGVEMRAPKVTDAVNATKGEVISYNGELVKTPYFNQSDGTYTKSAEEVWGWTNTPYLVSTSDSYCDGTEFKGHGVGLSGCGAKGMAINGSDYKEILKHYYSGITISTQF